MPRNSHLQGGIGRNRPRVLLLAFDSEELSIRLASGLVEYADVCLMVPDERSRPYRQYLDQRVDLVPFRRPRLRQVGQQVAMIAHLLKRIRAFEPDLIHVQKWHLWFYLALPLFTRYPLVISIHDPYRHSGDAGQAKTPWTIVKFGYHRADRIIAHNSQMKESVVRDLGISPDVIDVVPLIERGDDRLAEDVQEPGNEILFFGRLWPYKGLDVLISAQPLISEKCPDARFIIAGKGEEFEKYRSMMEDPSRFEVHNEYVSPELQARLFRRASVVVLPYWDATQSGVIPVAYSFAKPVVATAVGGLPSQVDDRLTGILIPPGDPRRLAEAVIQLLANPSLRAQLGENGKRKVQMEWSAGVVARQTIETYRKLLAEREGG